MTVPPIVIEHALFIEGIYTTCQDAVETSSADGSLHVALADGAGGTSGGAVASKYAAREIVSREWDPRDPQEHVRAIRGLDGRIPSGETTLISAYFEAGRVIGASVGDSRCIHFSTEGILDLTKDQVRKPLLGSGEVDARNFSRKLLPGVIVIASDGLWNYAKREAIHRAALQENLYSLPGALADLARMRSGKLADDISFVCVRMRPARNPRQTYRL